MEEYVDAASSVSRLLVVQQGLLYLVSIVMRLEI